MSHKSARSSCPKEDVCHLTEYNKHDSHLRTVRLPAVYESSTICRVSKHRSDVAISLLQPNYSLGSSYANQQLTPTGGQSQDKHRQEVITMVSGRPTLMTSQTQQYIKDAQS
ncbi:hypothetical protein Bbelb_043300 [Branchiostoma belcheri]|nr:hypothetical protein Bbelb_043300 [Branchiostoma belcheri]